MNHEQSFHRSEKDTNWQRSHASHRLRQAFLALRQLEASRSLSGQLPLLATLQSPPGSALPQWPRAPFNRSVALIADPQA